MRLPSLCFWLTRPMAAKLTDSNKKKKPCQMQDFSVGLPGLEPGKAGPESAVLPLHHSPMLKCDAKIQQISLKKTFSPFFYTNISKKHSTIWYLG